MRAEPILLASLVQRDLQCADPDRQEPDAPIVDLCPYALEIGRIEYKQIGHDKRCDPDGDINVKDPSPAVAVGEPTAEHRSQYRCDDNAEAPEAHRLSALIGWESFEQNRL